jgi:hypothetical protein
MANILQPHLMIELNLIIFIAMIFSGLGLVLFRGDDLLNWEAYS